MANRFPLIFNSGAGQIQELAASDNLDLTSSNLVNAGILFTSSGSVTAPSLQIGSGTTYNPGLYSPGTDQLAVATNGVARLFVGATGDIGVGTISPGAKLDIGGNIRAISGTPFIYINNNVSQYALRNNGDSFTIEKDGTERLRITSTGALNFVGAGTAGSTQAVSFNGSAPVNSLVIDSSGRLGIGSSAPVGKVMILGADTTTFGTITNGALNLGTVNGTANGRFVNLNFGYDTGATNAPAAIGFTYTSATGNGAGSLYFGTRSVTTDTAPTERLVITSAGLVGIGTTGPDAHSQLHIVGSSYQPLYVNTTAAGGGGASFFRSGTQALYAGTAGSSWLTGSSTADGLIRSEANLIFATGGNNQRAQIDSSGRLLIGTSTSLTANGLLQVYKASGTVISLVDSDALADSEVSVLRVNGGTGSGEFGVYKHSGIASPCVFIDIQAQDGASNYYWTDNSDIFRTSTNTANIGTTGGTVVGTQSSDERIKNILGPVEYGLDILKQIEPVRYTLKTEPDTEKLGFIAQQVQPLVPQSVFDTKEYIEGEPEDAPTKLGMEYVALLPVLVNAIKELSAKNDALEARLAALESA